MELHRQTKSVMTFGLHIIALITLCLTANASQANDDLQQKMNDPANWASWGGDYAGTRYSPFDQINTKNVHQLQVAWMEPTGILHGHGGGPLIVDETIYIHTPYPNRVFAFNQKDQSIKWLYEGGGNAEAIFGKDKKLSPYKTINQGLAYGDGKIFLHQADTTLVALDAKTGRKVWSVQNGNPKIGSQLNSAPLVVKDKVIIGHYGAKKMDEAGFITAYNIKDGSLAWQGYSMGADEEMLMDPEKSQTWANGKMQPVGKNSSLNSWPEDRWKVGDSGTTGGITYDPNLNLIYYGSGFPFFGDPSLRIGDNRWSSSLWARDADTGIVKWVYQLTPHNEWIYSGENESILLDQDINGAPRQTLVHFDHNGFAYTLDRVTGELLSAEKYDDNVNWATHIDIKTGRPQLAEQYRTEINGENDIKGICPSHKGSKGLQPASYSPKSHLFYIPGDNQCMNLNREEPVIISDMATRNNVNEKWLIKELFQDTLSSTEQVFHLRSLELVSPKNAQHNIGDFESEGYFSAWDPNANKIKWQIIERYPIVSGSVVTAGDVVFYGTLEGHLKAVDANTGKELYRFKTPSGIVSNISSWEHNGKQYIGVLSGEGGSHHNALNDLMCDSKTDPHWTSLPNLSNTFRKICTQHKTGTFIVFSLPN